ncbi:MAG: hypothetical protein KAH86_00660 [Methanosarcinales archaeon]|nr:hypothetical protein [Methanosarcinales archaeon]
MRLTSTTGTVNSMGESTREAEDGVETLKSVMVPIDASMVHSLLPQWFMA